MVVLQVLRDSWGRRGDAVPDPDTLAACGWPAHPESGVPAAVDRAAGSQMTAWHRRGMTMAKRIIGAVIWIFPMVSNGCE